jgi:hypothetical protein
VEDREWGLGATGIRSQAFLWLIHRSAPVSSLEYKAELCAREMKGRRGQQDVEARMADRAEGERTREMRRMEVGVFIRTRSGGRHGKERVGRRGAVRGGNERCQGCRFQRRWQPETGSLAQIAIVMEYIIDFYEEFGGREFFAFRPCGVFTSFRCGL